MLHNQLNPIIPGVWNWNPKSTKEPCETPSLWKKVRYDRQMTPKFSFLLWRPFFTTQTTQHMSGFKQNCTSTLLHIFNVRNISAITLQILTKLYVSFWLKYNNKIWTSTWIISCHFDDFDKTLKIGFVDQEKQQHHQQQPL